MSEIKKFSDFFALNELRAVSDFEIEQARKAALEKLGIRNSKVIQNKILDDAIRQVISYEKDFRMDYKSDF